MLYKRRRERNRGKKSHRNYEKNYRYKIDNIYQKAKIKNLEQSLEFQKYNVKEKKKREKQRKKKVTAIMKKTIGTKLITYIKRLKLKIQSRVWNCRYTMLYKRRRERNRGKKSHRNYEKNYRYKIDNLYQKAKIKNLEQSLELQKYNVKKKEEKERERKNKQTRTNKVT